MDPAERKNDDGENDDDATNLPPAGAPVWVQCRGYRILAYRDRHGKWRSIAKDEELTGPVKVIEMG